LVAAPVLAIVATIAIRRHLAGRPAPPPDRRQLAFAVDLMVAVLRTGAPVERAIAAVTDAAGACGSPELIAAVGPLRRVGRLLELGADPGAAWRELGSEPAYAGVAAAGTRCAASGARLGGALADVAIALRQERLTRALARAERVGVWSLLPLGLCFLPAFICIGVVPVVAGVAGQVLSGVPS
jgi:pilus assembly protein TadC